MCILMSSVCGTFHLNRNYYSAEKKKTTFHTHFQLLLLKPKTRPSIWHPWPLSVQSSAWWSTSPLRHYQMVRLTPAQAERLNPCAARTSAQCKRVLGISSSSSGLGRTPSLGLATTMGSGACCGWNSTTWSCFLLASIWWVSCRVEEDKRRGRRGMFLKLQTQQDNSWLIFPSSTSVSPNSL